MLAKLVATIALLTAVSAETILYCNGQPYYPSAYTCYSGFLCPTISGERTLKCGGACYLPEAYTCVNGQLGQHPAITHAFSIKAKNSIPYLNGKSINAAGFRLVIGQSTAVYCPDIQGVPCSTFTNTTILTAGGSAMNTIVPGGQQTYIQSNGAFGYTQAHSAYVPPGAEIGEVAAYEQGYFIATNSSGWTACPLSGSTTIYQVFAKLHGLAFAPSCVGLNIVTTDVANGVYGAWQYT